MHGSSAHAFGDLGSPEKAGGLLTITPTQQGYALSIDLAGLLTSLNGPVAPMQSLPAPVTQALTPVVPDTHTVPEAPRRGADSAEVVSRPRSTKRTTKAAKAPKSPKAKGDGKAVMATIRDLQSQGRHGEAAALAAARGWQHIADSIVAKADKAADEVRNRKAVEDRVKREAERNDEVVTATKDEPADVAAAPSVPTKPGRPRCETHRIFLKGDGSCSRCSAPQVPVPAPATEAPARSAKSAGAPTGPTLYPPTVTSENDLLLHWSALVAAAGDSATRRNHLRSHMEIAYGREQHNARQANADGDRSGNMLHLKRSKALRRLIDSLRS